MDDGYELCLNRWQPDSEEDIKGVVQLHHGLAEHSLRYDRFGSVLAENGWVLNAYDMRGHGRSAEIADKNGTGIFGKLADKKGFDRAVLDLKAVTDNLKNDFPGKKTILMGHSFGSFVAQGFIEEYGNDIVTLKDDNNNEYTFEILDAIETEDGRYLAMMPKFDDPQKMLDDSGDLVIVKVQEDENGEEYFEDIPDDDEYDTIADLFVERLSELYDVEDK